MSDTFKLTYTENGEIKTRAIHKITHAPGHNDQSVITVLTGDRSNPYDTVIIAQTTNECRIALRQSGGHLEIAPSIQLSPRPEKEEPVEITFKDGDPKIVRGGIATPALHPY